MRLNNIAESESPKYNKPNYIDILYGAKDGKSRYEEIIQDSTSGEYSKAKKVMTSLGGIYIIYIGNGTKKRLLLTSGLHGNECIGPKVSSMFLSLKKIPPEASAMVIPVLNPNGFIGLHRRNGNNADSNRAFRDDDDTYKDIIKHIIEFDPTICVDLHEWHKSDGAFVYTNIVGLDKTIHEIIKDSGLHPTSKKKIKDDEVENGVIVRGKNQAPDGSLADWLAHHNYKYFLPESVTEADPWSQITFYKKIIDLALDLK